MVSLHGMIPECTTRIVETGHVIGAEIPEIVNPEIIEFLRGDAHLDTTDHDAR